MILNPSDVCLRLIHFKVTLILKHYPLKQKDMNVQLRMFLTQAFSCIEVAGQ